jgi:hypothetical protein
MKRRPPAEPGNGAFGNPAVVAGMAFVAGDW